VEPLGDPPANPEDWSDDEWIAWLEATDPDGGDQPAEEPPQTLGARVVRSPSGTVLAAAMSGVAEIFYEDQDPEIVVVAETPTPGGRGVTVTLDPDFPERSVVTFHPDDPDGSAPTTP